MNRNRFDTTAYRIALLSLLMFAAGYFATPVRDSDAWWHLASGRHIAASGSLPDTDPFGVYDTVDYWGKTILKGQWLGQLSLYGAYRAGDLEGVIGLRTALLLICLLTLVMRCSGESRIRLVVLVLLFLAAMALRGHTADRPQLFSFAFFGITLLFLERYHPGGNARALYALPPIFLVWANAHPGVMLGFVFLTAFTFLYVIEQRIVHRRGFRDADSRQLLMILGLCGLATIATPNGITSYEYLIRLETNPLQNLITEYISPFQLFLNLRNAPYLPYYWLLCLAALATLFVLLRQRRIVEAGLIVLITLISFNAVRYVPFMVIYSVPLIARYLGAYLERDGNRTRPWIFSATTLFFISLLAIGLVQGKALKGGFDREIYPVKLAEVVEQRDFNGRMFNTLNWGGYLTWNLWPATRVFIDGRLMESERKVPYTHVLWMTDYGRRFFEKSDFNLVMIAHRNLFAPDPRPFPLIEHLHNHPDWEMTYVDETGVLFVRVGL